MKAEDLMIGDWVGAAYPEEDCWRNIQIISTDLLNEGFIAYCDGICILPDMLEQNGFLFNMDNGRYEWKNVYLYPTGTRCHYVVDEWGIGIEGDRVELHKVITCVHELQHALRLCGIEKDIVL